jgi:methionine-gamma-lyase
MKIGNSAKPSELATLLIHADRELNPTAAVVPPIYQTANFFSTSPEDFLERSSRPRHPEFYTRNRNPNAAQVEAVLAQLEGAPAAMLTASGMAAVSVAVLGLIDHGMHVIAQTNHYGGTMSLLRNLLPRFGVQLSQVDQRSPDDFEKAIRPNTKLIVLESPSNPPLHLTDLRAVAAIAKAHGALTVVDNTFATPLNQRPVQMGIDVVVHSVTKYLGGHSDLIAGAVLSTDALIEKIWNTQLILGAALGPFDAWLILRGLRTLSLRMSTHNANALALAQFLANHAAVKYVNYPGLESHPQYELACRQMTGFGGVLSFEVDGGYESAKRVLRRLHLVGIATSVGGVESLAVLCGDNFTHHLNVEEAQRAGIPAGLIRVSVGLEDIGDLVADFDQALSV